MVDTEDGPFWVIDGQKIAPSGRKAVGAIRADAHGFRPGTAATRIEDMDHATLDRRPTLERRDMAGIALRSLFAFGRRFLRGEA